MKYCKNCGAESLTKTIQTFKDGTKHLRVDCSKCNTFNGYEKQHNGFDKLLVKDFKVDNDNQIQHLMFEISEALQTIDLNDHSLTIVLKARSL